MTRDVPTMPDPEPARIRPVVRENVPLAPLTTIGLGGPARRLVEAGSDTEIVDAVATADAAGEPVLIVAGGSNLVIADEGFPGTVVRLASRGITTETEADAVRLQVAAGEPWDELVARCVADELAGIECLSGIPGLTGATPIQNVGAYGQQVADTITSVRAYDRRARAVLELDAAQCGFAYRTSVFRHSERYVVLGAGFTLARSPRAVPIRYAELARALGAEPGARPPLSAVRDTVLALRRGKGMVLDPGDPDSRSVGSFFLNPILPAASFTAFQERAAARLGADVHPPGWPDRPGHVKTSAAWLIERAGFPRGYGAGRVGISRKHTLALVNRGAATTTELLVLAREIRDGVQEAFGVTLTPEPRLVGAAL